MELVVSRVLVTTVGSVALTVEVRVVHLVSFRSVEPTTNKEPLSIIELHAKPATEVDPVHLASARVVSPLMVSL